MIPYTQRAEYLGLYKRDICFSSYFAGLILRTSATITLKWTSHGRHLLSEFRIFTQKKKYLCNNLSISSTSNYRAATIRRPSCTRQFKKKGWKKKKHVNYLEVNPRSENRQQCRNAIDREESEAVFVHTQHHLQAPRYRLDVIVGLWKNVSIWILMCLKQKKLYNKKIIIICIYLIYFKFYCKLKFVNKFQYWLKYPNIT